MGYVELNFSSSSSSSNKKERLLKEESTKVDEEQKSREYASKQLAQNEVDNFKLKIQDSQLSLQPNIQHSQSKSNMSF